MVSKSDEDSIPTALRAKPTPVVDLHFMEKADWRSLLSDHKDAMRQLVRDALWAERAVHVQHGYQDSPRVEQIEWMIEWLGEHEDSILSVDIVPTMGDERAKETL